MDANKLFSIQSNGYNIGEVDDYINFIQTELTKNMKNKRDAQKQQDALTEIIEQLSAENKSLYDKNQKLYRDCVAFAKRLKALEVYENPPEESNKSNDEKGTVLDAETSMMLAEIKASYKSLIDENQALKAQLAAMSAPADEFNDILSEASEQSDTVPGQQDLFSSENEIITQEFTEETPDSSFQKEIYSNTDAEQAADEQTNSSDTVSEDIITQFEENPSQVIEPLVSPASNAEGTPDGQKTVTIVKPKKNYFVSIANFIVTFVLIVSIFTAVISGASVYFKKNPGLTVFGYRTYPVQTVSEYFGYNTSDVLITKKIPPLDVKPGYIVLYADSKTGQRYTEMVSSVSTESGKIFYNVKESPKSESVKKISESSVCGVVTSKMIHLGTVVKFAVHNTTDYIIIVAAAFLLSLLCKILIHMYRSKQMRSKFLEYNEDDFSLNV